MKRHFCIAHARHAVLALAAVVPLIAVIGCEQSRVGAAIAPAAAPSVVVVITTGAIAVYPATYCANVGVLSPNLNLVVSSARADVAVDQVTLHLLDGSNVGGPGITFQQPALNAQFADTVVRGGTSRTFVLTPTFRCGVSAPRSIRGDVGIVDSTGARTSLSTTVTFP